MNYVPGLGAQPSQNDNRTVNYEPTMAALYTVGGVDYLPNEIENQHTVGICTAIALVQEREKVNCKKYSPDFQYLLQKKYYDSLGGLPWYEGSSLLSSLKVGKKYGFLPADKWTYTTEADRSLPYTQYVAKLQAIPDAEVQRLIGLCVDKIMGYAQIDVNNPSAIAKAISESKAGIFTRFAVGKEWWTKADGTSSWDPVDIDPLRPPVQVVSGHAITMSKFDYTVTTSQVLANTWGIQWNKQGTADVIWDNYRPTEAWVVVEKVYFTKDLKLGMTDPDVKLLQVFLNTHGFPVATSGQGSPGNETEYFGGLTQKAVIKLQTSYNIQPPAGYFGLITRTKVNSML